MLLHLGCGYERKPGWINVDMAGLPVDLVWDLRKKLPFASGSVHGIFHEHLLEHLPLPSGLSLLRECHRLLKPSGALRIGVPDAERYARWYLDGNFPRDGRPTPLLALTEQFYGFGHRMMYDEATLLTILREVGFSSAERTGFGTSCFTPAPDTAFREWDSLYVEAVK